MDDMDQQQLIDEQIDRERSKNAAGNLDVDWESKPKHVQKSRKIVGVEAVRAWVESHKDTRESV